MNKRPGNYKVFNSLVNSDYEILGISLSKHSEWTFEVKNYGRRKDHFFADRKKEYNCQIGTIEIGIEE